ncbi:aminoglycoside phosphotransferase [Aspergillus piperis CBS 112811]|uniref:Aminoglycoside phosphotransferase n=1 Tax=Aspergillus piperis CBS 112811 TaxID=1448313 RepID=A0A8G1R692_9EURO|nr:aminoglycoside phosphotransferase [Aspergillus piperis CBS 112811]RAH60866.1 aminoglycoside phosphotransferase [Aspergillus piperis CBS 112811]
MSDTYTGYDECGCSLAEQSMRRHFNPIRFIRGSRAGGVWAIGTDLILKAHPKFEESLENERQALQLLVAHPHIPAPKADRNWVDQHGNHFSMQTQLDGETLENAWPRLSKDQKATIADQVADVCKQLQSITSPSIQGIDGGACPLDMVFDDGELQGPFHSDSEFRDAISRELSSSLFSNKKDELMKHFPVCGPYVLTHGDLNISNIMVKDGQLVGIIDWEFAAFYPIWYEYLRIACGSTGKDAEWRELLRQRLDSHEDAKSFLKELRNLQWYNRFGD